MENKTHAQRIHEMKGNHAKRTNQNIANIGIEFMLEVNNSYKIILQKIINKEITAEESLKTLNILDQSLKKENNFNWT